MIFDLIYASAPILFVGLLLLLAHNARNGIRQGDCFYAGVLVINLVLFVFFARWLHFLPVRGVSLALLGTTGFVLFVLVGLPAICRTCIIILHGWRMALFDRLEPE